MKRFTILLFVVAAVGVGSPTAIAGDSPESWQPVAPEGLPTDFDWIRLPSDEWLKGEIITMYDDVLKFESDELDELTFDFDDIKELRSARVVQVGFEKGEPAIGRLIVDGGVARVIGDEGEVEFDRAEILSIIVGEPKERNYWSGYTSAGGNIRSGNTDQVDFTARLGLIRRTIKNRAGFQYIGSITRIDSENTSNNHRANLGWDHFISHRLFVNVVGVEWYRDPFQNIANRWTVSAGLGYEIIDTDRTSWNVSAGPAWQSTEWNSVEPGEDDTASSLALRIGTEFDIELTDNIDYYAHYDAFFADKASGSYTHHFDTGLEIDLIGELDLSVSWIWDYIADPRPLEDGSVPEKDDTRLVFGFGWSF